MVNGHLDGLTGGYIVGWAEDGPTTCEIAIRMRDGSLVASGHASWNRPDLASLKLGRTNLAFRIPVPKTTEATELHVFANGVELRNSPVMVGLGFYDGKMSAAGGNVEGWVTERSPGFEAPFITILDQDGRIVARTQSVISDTNTDPMFTPADFFAELDQSCFGRGEVSLTAYANGVRCATASCDLLLEGNLEILEPLVCSGWLFSPSAPHRTFEIDIRRNDEAVIVARCRIPRSDVKGRFPDSRNPGFSKTFLPTETGALDVTTLSLRLPNSDLELFDGPFVLANRPALIEAGRRVAQSAFDPGIALDTTGRAVLQAAMTDFLAKTRATELQALRQAPRALEAQTRLNVIIPVYRGVEITRTCIDSVLATRLADKDRIIVVNDCAPEADMAAMLRTYANTPNMHILTNAVNAGFVKSVNRALGFCRGGDVLLLNSDTEVFPGGLDQLWRAAHSSPTIGTVTAMSNNATIFSYPHVTLRTATLPDMDWAGLAAAALDRNAGLVVDVPTGHGFCMLIRADVLRHVGLFDELFGRGYGEENDFCNRAADQGYRNVVAGGVFVLHHESISFRGEKAQLIAQNMLRLDARYPEYTPTIMEVERRDDLRSCRWQLDAARLERASALGTRFVLVVRHSIGGGTARAIADIEAAVGYGGAEKLDLACRPDGFLELTAQNPALYAVFSPGETNELMRVLAAADIGLVVVHQLLGYTAAFLDALGTYIEHRRSVFYAHDFYPLCPRVTMINAVGQFCRLAPAEVCTRCVTVGGDHSNSRLTDLAPPAHRALFAGLLGRFTHVVTPSEDAALYLRRGFADLAVEAVEHPVAGWVRPIAMRQHAMPQITVFGALGSHKGSIKLLEIARLARLEQPDMRFRLVGFSDIDEALLEVGNVEVTGPYTPSDLPRLVGACTGRFALFLSEWPETFSYTLSEALQYGFTPIVPDLGAPAERVRKLGIGTIYPFPSSAGIILAKLAAVLAEEPDHPAVIDADVVADTTNIDRTKAILLGVGYQAKEAMTCIVQPKLAVIDPPTAKGKPFRKQKRSA